MTILPKTKCNLGQTLLVVVLVISVSLMVVMSVIARSITDVKISDKEDQSLRAFSAAEAGVEKVLLAGSSQSSLDIGNGASFTATTTAMQGSKSFIIPGTYTSGDVATVWFADHKTDGTLIQSFTGTSMTVCWDQDAAIEVVIYYAASLSPLSSTAVIRTTADPDGSRIGSNSFGSADSGSCTINETVFPHKKVVALPSGVILIFARIRPVYNSLGVKFGITSSSLFPSQGVVVNSSGVAGESNRKISVLQGYGEVPSVFESALFSLGDIQK